MTPSGDPFDSGDGSKSDDFGELAASGPPRKNRDPLVRPQMKLSPMQQMQVMLFNTWERLRTPRASMDRLGIGRTKSRSSHAVVVGGAICSLVAMLALGFFVGNHRAPESNVSVGAAPAQPLATLPLLGGPLAPLGSTVGSGSLTSVVGGSGPGSSSVPGAAPATIAVHAAGAVAKPAVYNLPAGARVDDVITAAGGLGIDADTDAVNLAAHVGDGERVFVPRKGQAIPVVQIGGAWPASGEKVTSGVTTGSGVGSTSGTVLKPVDLNVATAAELDTLPGIGLMTAQKILDFRTRIGRFKSVSQLLEVPGIGDAKLTALRSHVRV